MKQQLITSAAALLCSWCLSPITGSAISAISTFPCRIFFLSLLALFPSIVPDLLFLSFRKISSYHLAVLLPDFFVVLKHGFLLIRKTFLQGLALLLPGHLLRSEEHTSELQSR